MRKVNSRRKSTEIFDSTKLLNPAEIPEVESRLLEYLEVSLKQFRPVEEAFREAEPNLQRDPELIPVLSIKVPLDEGDIRPDYFDEW